jgi:hypothetical protein
MAESGMQAIMSPGLKFGVPVLRRLDLQQQTPGIKGVMAGFDRGRVETP